MTKQILKKIDARNLLVLGLSLILALIAAEGFLRLFPTFLPQEAQLKIHWHEMGGGKTLSVPHPYIGFVYPPHIRRTVEQGDVRFSSTSDEHGFRNPSPWPNEAEIVAVGDSTTFSYGVDDEQAWPRLVQQGLGQSRVINLGLDGAAPQQYLRIYEIFGVPLRPKVLIMGLFPPNDVYDAQQFDGWLKAGAQGNYAVWRLFGGSPSAGKSALESIKRSSYLYTLWDEARKSLQSSQGYDGETLKFPTGARMNFTPAMLERLTKRVRTDDSMFQLVINTIEQTHKLAQSHGTELLVILIPSKEEVYLPILGKPTPQPIDVFLPELEKRHIPYLDLRPHLQRLARQNEVLYFEVDGHHNAQGYAAIADAVLARLQAGAGRYALRDQE
jgi:hypothetical protein